MNRALLVCPIFENEELAFLNFLFNRYKVVDKYLYQELGYRKTDVFSLILSNAIKFLGLVKISLKIRWLPKDYNLNLLNSIGHEKYDLILIVKGFMLSKNSLNHLKSQLTTDGKIVIYNYDTVRRFPFLFDLPSWLSIITFDINDAIKYKYFYSPIPNGLKNKEEIGFHSVVKFAGTFSIYRFFRLLVVSAVFRLKNIRHIFYLRLPFIKKKYKFFNLYIGALRRHLKLRGYIALDIPQAQQSGGSARTRFNTRALTISYSYMTPGWRTINLSNVLSTITTASNISDIVKMNLLKVLYNEELGYAESCFEIALDNAFKKKLNNI